MNLKHLGKTFTTENIEALRHWIQSQRELQALKDWVGDGITGDIHRLNLRKRILEGSERASCCQALGTLFNPIIAGPRPSDVSYDPLGASPCMCAC